MNSREPFLQPDVQGVVDEKSQIFCWLIVDCWDSLLSYREVFPGFTFLALFSRPNQTQSRVPTGGHRGVTMRFELNFAAVVRNLAVLANVVNLTVELFVAIYQPVRHTMFGHGTPQRIEHPLLLSWCSDSCLGSSVDRNLAAMDLAFAVISPEREITSGGRQERLTSKRRHLMSTTGTRG